MVGSLMRTLLNALDKIVIRSKAMKYRKSVNYKASKTNNVAVNIGLEWIFKGQHMLSSFHGKDCPWEGREVGHYAHVAKYIPRVHTEFSTNSPA